MNNKTQLKSLWNIIKNYKWKSTFFNYLKNLFFLLLIPTLILTAGLLYFYHTSNIKTIQSTNLQSILKTQGSIEKMLVDINKLNYILLNNKNVAASVLNTKDKLNTPETLRQRQYTLDILNNYLNSTEIIDSIYIYSVQSNFVISSEMCSDVEYFYDKSWYETYKKNESSLFIQTSYPKDNGTNKALLSFIYPLNYNRITDGLVVINMRLNTLNEYINIYNEETVNLITHDNIIIYSSNNSIINSKYNKPIPDCKNPVIKMQKNKIYCFSEIENYPLILASESEIPYTLKGSNLIMLFICYMILLILLLITLSFILSAKFYFDISDIIVAIGLSESVTSETSNNNELQFIRTSILNNLRRIETIESELYKKSDKLKHSQQIALQMQISPHFMLNTLNTVNLLLLTSKEPNDKVVQINSLLSEILSDILNTSKYIVSIAEEIEYTKKYIEIESYKSIDGFDVEWDIDSQCLKLKTIKFILQPIIENSIFHGIKYLRDKRGKIIITVKKSESNIVFTISDNGTGMDNLTMQRLNKSAQDQSLPQDKHLGFLNVNMRIKLTYGNEYGCKIIKSNLNGTIVQIIIPSKI